MNLAMHTTIVKSVLFRHSCHKCFENYEECDKTFFFGPVKWPSVQLNFVIPQDLISCKDSVALGKTVQWPWQRSNWSGWCLLGRSLLDVSTLMIKIFQTQRWQFVQTSNVANVKTFCDFSDLENKVKVNKRSCHYAS